MLWVVCVCIRLTSPELAFEYQSEMVESGDVLDSDKPELSS